MLTRRRVLATSAAGLAGASFAGRAFTQTLKKPAHMIVGFPPGGATDVAARLLADRLRASYAPTVLVENKAGAAARLAGEFVKNAEPDGSVMLFTPDFPLSIYPHSFRSLNYDPLRDFIAVAPATKSMLTFNIGPAVPAAVRTLADFMQWARANPGRAQYATTAAGGSPHFVGAMLASEAGVRMTPVHYRGGAPALQDLLGGHVPASVNPIAEALPQKQSGALRILAVTGSQRSRFAPDVPTAREQGFNVAIDSWLGVFVPARTPTDVVNALNAAIGEAARSPEMTAALEKFGNEPFFETPQQFALTLKAAIERWGPVVKASGFVAEE
jgi:tripartite-type tricarboxylate transporter receptor subunit TctC